MPASPATAAPPPPSRAMRIALAAGFAATVVGLIAHDTWRVLPAERFALSLVLAGLTSLIAWPLRRAFRCRMATLLAALWTMALVVYAGALPVLASATLGAAALGIGSWFVPKSTPTRAAIAVVVGLVVIAGVTGWTLAWPVHRTIVWWPLLALVIAWRRRAIGEAVRAIATGWRSAVGETPRGAAATVLLFGLASTACWLPSLQMDDLTYHLGLPTQLRLHGVYAPDARVQMWAYAPWAGDVLHGIVGVLARREAHDAMNALWLLAMAGAAASLLASLHAAPRERIAALALLASLPPLVWMAAGQQTELAATAVTLALAAVIVADAPGRPWAGAALFAGLCALKPVHGIAALPLLAYAAWRHRGAWPWTRLPIAVALFAAVALSSGVAAWRATGNPLLSLFNQVFRSPVMPAVQLDDARWHAGLAFDLPWRMVFDTDRYLEGWDGALGFAPIALGGVLLLALLRPRRRGLLLCALAAMLLPLLSMQYARYAWPGLGLLIVLLPIGMDAASGRRTFAWALGALCTLDLAYQANASWLHHASAFKRTLRSPFDDTAVLRTWLPERLLLRRLPTNDDGLVLATDSQRGFVAELGGRGRTVSPHAPWLQREAQAADGDASGAAWRRLFAAHGIRWTLTDEATASPALRAALRDAGAHAFAREGTTTLWRLARSPAPAATP
ncbi:MAG: hypothetical protein ACTHOH_14095 [Lysobacteraceae bacterium]